MKKILALALSLCLLLTAATAFAAELLPAGDTYPLKTDKTISWYSQDCLNPHEKYADWKESPFHTNLAKLLGVNIEWSFPTTGADGGSFTNTMMADPSTLPNIMKGYFMDSANMLLDDEVIWDLTPYIQEYAPAYYAWLQTNPAYDRAMKTDDGRYYAFGFFREDGGWNDSYLGVVVRQDWLKECGLEVPTTIAELENVIRVFNEKYDGAQFAFANDGRFRQAGIQGAFGAYATGYVASDYGWFVKDGKLGFGATQPEWREYMKWLNKMWEAGLIDQDSFSLDDTSIKSKSETGKCGVSYTSMGQLNLWNKDMGDDIWVGAHFPVAEDGSISSQFGGFGIGTHTTVITKTADEETMKLCLQMLDYAYTQEGFLFWNYGVEGESWEYGENGLPKWTPLVADDKDNDPMTKYNGATWGNSCIQATNLLYLKNSPVAIAANDAFFYTFGKDEYFADPEVEAKTLAVTGGWKWPVGITFTTDESDQLDLLGGNSNLNTYVAENYAAFITGSKDIEDDAVWNDYLAGFSALNLDKIIAIRQGALDRYEAR